MQPRDMIRINNFCYNLLANCIGFTSFDDIIGNRRIPGLILKCRNTDFGYLSYVEDRLKYSNLIEYFFTKEFKNSIHINLKKEYIDKIDNLKTLLRIKGFTF